MVLTHLNNISQIGSFPLVGVKIENVWNHHLVIAIYGSCTFSIFEPKRKSVTVFCLNAFTHTEQRHGETIQTTRSHVCITISTNPRATNASIYIYNHIYILKLSTWLVNRTSWCFCYYPIVPQKNATSNLDQIWGSKRLAVKQFVATSRPGGTLGWICKDPLVCMVMVSIAAIEIAKKKHVVIEADGFERKGPTTSKKCNSFGYPSSHFWCELGGNSIMATTSPDFMCIYIWNLLLQGRLLLLDGNLQDWFPKRAQLLLKPKQQESDIQTCHLTKHHMQPYECMWWMNTRLPSKKHGYLDVPGCY